MLISPEPFINPISSPRKQVSRPRPAERECDVQEPPHFIVQLKETTDRPGRGEGQGKDLRRNDDDDAHISEHVAPIHPTRLGR
jgi:hypothetical protein